MHQHYQLAPHLHLNLCTLSFGTIINKRRGEQKPAEIYYKGTVWLYGCGEWRWSGVEGLNINVIPSAMLIQARLATYTYLILRGGPTSHVRV